MLEGPLTTLGRESARDGLNCVSILVYRRTETLFALLTFPYGNTRRRRIKASLVRQNLVRFSLDFYLQS